MFNYAALTTANRGASDYVATGSDYDGTNDYARRLADLTGMADGKAGIISVWIRIDGEDQTDTENRNILCTSNSPGLTVGFVLAHQRMSFRTFNIMGITSGAENCFNFKTKTAYGVSQIWRHFLASWNCAVVGARHLYMNDVNDLVVLDFQDRTIDYTKDDWRVATSWSVAGEEKFDGCISELFFHNTYLDLSVEANRRKFIGADGRPVDLGADGSTPLGVQPLLYVPNGDPSTNAGSGGNFTITGSLTSASTSPSD